MRPAISLMLALGVTAPGCGTNKDGRVMHEPAPATRYTGTRLADHYKACIALINDAKFDAFKSDCVGASYTRHAVAGTPELKGADNLVASFQRRKHAMPDWKLEPQLIMVSGRNLLAMNLVTGTHTGTLTTPAGEVPATNKRFGQLMFHRVAIDDANRVTDEWAYVDEMTMLAQLGIAPDGTPPKRPALDKGWDAPIVVVSAGDAQEKANLELVKQGNDAFVANEPAKLLAIYADDVIDSGQHSDKDIRGKQALEEGFRAFRNLWTEVNVSSLEAWAAGDYVIQTFTFEGKNGQTVRLQVAQILHVKDGKVDQLWAF